MILVLGTALAFGATMLGSVWHAIWAGIPLGLCVLAFTPPAAVDAISKFVPFVSGKSFEEIGTKWGIREEKGDPDSPTSEYAWIDESNYYYIKVNNEPESDDVVRRTLVLDNLIHGYFVLGHPERLDYDYEHIYALVAYRAAKASEKVIFKAAPAPATATDAKTAAPGSPATGTSGKKDQASPAPEATGGTGLPKPAESTTAKDAPAGKTPEIKEPGDRSKEPPGGLRSVQASGPPEKEKATTPAPEKAPGDNATSQPFDMMEDEGRSELPVVEKSSMTTLFLGGGAYCFQRHMQFAYPGTAVDVAEIDPSVTRANFKATGLPVNTPIQTYWGDARQFVDLHQDTKKYDLVFGDAFNDFSVPWHLTTREFNEKIKKMLTSQRRLHDQHHRRLRVGR